MTDPLADPTRRAWESEPDSADWVDPVTGLACAARRSGFNGTWNGYVGVPEGHPLFGASYDDVDVAVYGGLTYAGDLGGNGTWWLGFDCAKANDYKPRWDYGTEYRTLGFVRRECADLAAQLAAKAHR